MKKRLYEPINTFMVRTPAFESEKFFDFFNGNSDNEKILDHIKILCKNSVFRESILIGSRSLYNTMIDFCEGKSIRKQEYFLQSIYKYLIRISTRPTPFGLFSGVDFGSYSEEKTDISYSDNKHRKYVRPDIEWLIDVVKFIEKKEYMNLKYTINDSIFKKGDRAFLLYSTRKEEDENDVEEISVRITEPLENVLKAAKKPIFYNDLKELLINDNQDVSEEKIENYLKGLIENEYLISSLRPPLTIEDQLVYIIAKLDELDIETDLKNQLLEIREMLYEYMKTGLGEGEELYKSVYDKMKGLVSAENILQVDMKLNLKEKILSTKVIDEMNDLINILLTLSTPYKNKDSYLKRYKNDYIERYGQDREVELLEMLDNDRGIGAPIGYAHPQNNRDEYTVLNTEINEKLKRYFSDKYIDAVKNKKSIIITDKEVKELQLEEYSYNEIPNSLEINLIIKSNSKDNIDNNLKYYIGPNFGSEHAGKSFGRFSYMMKEATECFNILSKDELEKKISDDYVTCELVYLPSDARIANVSRNIHRSQYELALFINNSMDDDHRLYLDDIVIGLENDRFYAKSKSLNKRLIITMNNMLNIEFAPNSIKFLHDIEFDGYKTWYEFIWKNIFRDAIYIPKVQYKNFTITPETWIVNKELLKINKKTSFGEFKNAVKIYCKKYDIPQYIYIASLDNRILLNTKDDKSLTILQHEINNSNADIVLNSYEDDGFNVVTDSEENSYMCELVIPLVKRKIKQLKEVSIEKRTNNISSLSNERLKVPFDDWLYLKLYGVTSNLEDLIAFYISEYCTEKINNGEINRYFFMRYADPVPHIRLRFNSTSKQLLDLYPDIKEWLVDLMNKGIINRYTIDSYDREIERYGGLELMDIAESVFFFDSMVVENILAEKRLNNITFSKELIGIISIIHYMESYGIKYEDQVDFLRTHVKPSDYRDDFNKNRKDYMNLCNSSNEWEHLKENEEGILLLNILNQRSQIVRKYSERINECLNHIEMLSILDSIIHLHCNRLFGIDRKFEKKVRALASHTLYALKYFKRNE
ncbi:lantibiotic dehydratase [Clostridium beijerinckii]|uniref:lantibiotic dehydratase n=1 Tax=Clostridium beijerinckii TaxID=1520 RepID=UPI00047BC954|nr:lantibiotic dehydratase [Clostridium beijerinckii]